MEKKLLFFLPILLLLSQMIYSQGEGNVWYFGNNAGLDFSNGIPIALNNGQVNSNEGTASISDSSGFLLFYTDGTKVWNRNHNLMPNGIGLLGHPSSSQAALIVPKPDSSTIYYIFTTDESGNENGLRYTEVDMSLEGGKGDVTMKNILLTTPVCEKITAVHKADDSGYWIITRGFPGNSFIVYSLTASGINPVPVISNAGIHMLDAVQTVGQMKVSPDGTKLVSCSFQQKLELFDFNIANGTVSNARIINNKLANYGAEFSPSGNVLYVTTGNGYYVYDLVQYDLTVANIPDSAVHLKTNIPYQFGELQLGPDGKIYMAIINSNYIAYVDQPEVIGLGCNVVKNGIFLGNATSTFGLPQFIQSYFKSSKLVQLVCHGSPATFDFPSDLNISSVVWDFGDGNSSSQSSTTHIYEAPGTYEVSVSAHGEIGNIKKNWQIIVSEVPVAHRVFSQVVCGNAGTLYNLKKNDVAILGSQDPDNFRIDYFLSEADAMAHDNMLPSLYSLPMGISVFYAKIYNIHNFQCYEMRSFSVELLNQLSIGAVSDYIVCENASGTAVFNLLTKTAEVLNGYSSSLFSVTYHSSFQAAEDGVEALSSIYESTLSEEIIYARLQNNDDPSCFAITSFKLRLIEEPTIGAVSPFKQCGEAGSEISTFVLSQKTAEILGTLTPSLYQVTYHVSLAEATNAANPILLPYTNVVNNQTIYFAITSIGNACRVTGSFELVVNPKPIPIRFRPRVLKLCDIDNNGSELFDFSSLTTTLLSEQMPNQFAVSYHFSYEEAQSGINPLPSNYQNISNPQTIYIRIQNTSNPDCFEMGYLNISTHHTPVATKPDDINLCSNEAGGNWAEIDLHVQDAVILNNLPDTEFKVSYYTSLQDAQNEQNPIVGSFQYPLSSQYIFARVNNIQCSQCYDITDFQVIVNPKPVLEMEQVYMLCGNNPAIISAPSGFDRYYWSTGETTQTISVSNPTDVSLTVARNYGTISCENTITLSVIQSSAASIKDVEIKDWTQNQNSIEVVVVGSGDYEYSIDGQHYQESPSFYGLEMGPYTVYVRDKNGCGITTKDIYLLLYPKFFTPNGDGLHDRWQIKFAKFEPDLRVSIFDKSGRLVASFNGENEGWDGTAGSKVMPASDYWFVVTRKSGVIYRGHFSLLR